MIESDVEKIVPEDLAMNLPIWYRVLLIHTHTHTHTHKHTHTRIICIYVFACVCVCACACVHTHTHTHTPQCMHVRMYVCINVYLHVCMYVCMHTCMHVRIYIGTGRRSQQLAHEGFILRCVCCVCAVAACPLQHRRLYKIFLCTKYFLYLYRRRLPTATLPTAPERMCHCVCV